MSKNDLIGLGFCGLLIGGTIAGIRYLFKKEEDERRERLEKEAEFREFKDSYLEEKQFETNIKTCTLNNDLLNEKDRAYAYRKAEVMWGSLCLAFDKDTLLQRGSKLDTLLINLCGDKKSVNSYIIYLHETDAINTRKEEEAYLHRKEQEKIDLEKEKIKADKEKYKMQLDTEVEKGKNIVEAVKAVAGGKESKQDVNVTINNKEEK